MDFYVATAKGLDLLNEALPKAGLHISPATVDHLKFRLLEQIATRQLILNDPVFGEFLTTIGFASAVTIVVTSGIPDPYDAWTGIYNGKQALFFNLDQFAIHDLQQRAMPILKHEITHLLLNPFLARETNLSYRERLDRIILDEGVAHFMGFDGNRASLLSDFGEKWFAAENQLRIALSRLESPDETLEQKEDLLVSADTGAFWSKYGAIAGMFRAARIYEEQGIGGLLSAIETNHLPLLQSQCSGMNGAYSDKSLALWEVKRLPGLK